MAWEHWAGNGEAFGSGQCVWRLTVQRGDDVEVRKVQNLDYLCVSLADFDD
jgi:hypothetical protein